MEAFSDLFAFVSGAPGLAILALAALTLFLTADWRLSLTALLVEYLAVGLVLTRFLPPEVALAKVLTGAFAVFMLYLAARRVQEVQPLLLNKLPSRRFLGLQISWGGGPLGLPLRLLVVLLVTLGIVRLFASYRFPLISIDVAFVTCWLGSLGLMGLALSGEPLRVAPALLTILAAFDLVYASLAPNLAVAGFFAALILLAALAFSYLITVHGLAGGQQPTEEEAEA
jgi:hypothetical protein